MVNEVQQSVRYDERLKVWVATLAMGNSTWTDATCKSKAAATRALNRRIKMWSVR